jgi:hypothetical protein
MSAMSSLRAAAVAASCFVSCSLVAQTAPSAEHWEYLRLHSGVHANPSSVEGVVWRDFVIASPGSPWVRLYFADVALEKGSYLRMVSLRDGSLQTMEMRHVKEWSDSSAYFNGNVVMVELVAGPNTTRNEVGIKKVLVGDIGVVTTDTICGTQDNRTPSTHAAVGRINTIGCTGWIIDVTDGSGGRLHLSAGHCVASGQVLQFAVPASNTNCSLVHPPASKQFAIDTATSMSVNGGTGNDYWVFRCFANSTTGRTTFQEQASAFTLATSLPAVGTTLRNYGFGLDGTPTNNATGSSCSCSSPNGARNQTQQTHTGSFSSLSGNSLRHTIDTCGGNSGSVLLNNATGAAVAIHTHGGCSSGGGSNSGTAITHSGLQSAIAAMSGSGGSWHSVSWIRETPHPYANSQVYSFTYSHASATQIALHFNRLDTESGWDFVRIKNGSGTTIFSVSGNPITGGTGSAFGRTDGWAIIAGNTITVELTTDSSVTDWGFLVDTASAFF